LVHLHRGHGRGHRAAQGAALPGLLRRGVPDGAARPRAARQAPAGGRDRLGEPAARARQGRERGQGGARRRGRRAVAARRRGRLRRAAPPLSRAAAPHPRTPPPTSLRPGRAVTVTSNTPTGATYAAAGVDIEAGDRAVELMKTWVGKATRPEVLGGLGGFAGLFDASAFLRYRRPLLATSTDGVGTKVAVAQAMDKHDTIGHDLVGMVVDDLVVCGAEPLFMTDYIATGRVVPERIAAVVKSI